MPNVPRVPTDSAIMSLLSMVALDWHASELAYVEAIASVQEDVEQHLTAAQQARARADDRLSRVRRKWQDGVIDDQEFKEQQQELVQDREAAADLAARLQARRDTIGETPTIVALSEAREWLAATLGAVAANDLDRVDIDQFRAVACRVLDHVVVHHGHKPTLVNDFICEPIAVGDLTLEPVWKASMVLAPPDLCLGTFNGQEVLQGSEYPRVQQVPLASSNIERDGNAGQGTEA